MKLDKYFCQTRKYILEKYNINTDTKPEDMKTRGMLEKLTTNPMNYFRGLESEKEKREFMHLIHRNIGLSNIGRHKQEE